MSSSSFVHPPQQPTASFAPSQPDDPNSPVLFKHNINLVQTQISTIRSLAHEALNAMCVLFIFIRVLLPVELVGELVPSADEGPAPAKVPTSLDRAPHMQQSLAALRQCLRTLNDVLYTTGVGSLPLLPPEATEPSTEEQLAEQANKAISTLFALHTRMQETAAVAASIMAAPEQAPRR